MNSAQGNGNSLNTAPHRRRGSLSISIAGGTPAQRSALRESLAALTDLRMEIAEISAPGQAPPQGDSVRILMILLDDDLDLWDEELRPWIENGNWSQVTAVVGHRTPEAVRSALGAGANEVLFMSTRSTSRARCGPSAKSIAKADR